MGRLIICSGQKTEVPYYFKITDTRVYTIEELCYYIYNNLDILNREFFNDSLCSWLEDNVRLKECGQSLRKLLETDSELKDLVGAILCSCDYYSEPEIRNILSYVQEIERLSPYEKKKKKADNYLRYRQFTEAETEYMEILEGKETPSLSSEVYGNIVHNLGVIQLNTQGVQAAARSFKEAYERNHNEESLKAYLLALKLGNQEELYRKETESYQVDQEFQEQLETELNLRMSEAEQGAEYKVISQLKEYKTSGRITQFYQTAENAVEDWKKQYRRENA